MLCAFGALCGRCRGQTGERCGSSCQETGNLVMLACDPSAIECNLSYYSGSGLDFLGCFMFDRFFIIHGAVHI